MSKEESVEAPLMRTCQVLVMANTLPKAQHTQSLTFTTLLRAADC